MKLQIGENLKKLRSRHGLTQEQLAEALGVSCQSVSRWEIGVCYPDLELLPSIANLFDISLDHLVGMEHIRSEAKRTALFTEALELERQENWGAAITVLRNAVRTYPNDDGFAAELALALSKTGARQDQAEAISLSEKVLDRCTDEKLRSTVRANLCFLYKDTAQAEKALVLGKTLPHIWECREILLPDLVPEENRSKAVARSLNLAKQVLKDVACHHPILFSIGYRPEEHADIQSLLDALLGQE